MPHEAAYIMAPFQGIYENPPFEVSGKCGDGNNAGTVEAKVFSTDGKTAPVVIKAEGLAGGSGETVRIILELPEGGKVEYKFTI